MHLTYRNGHINDLKKLRQLAILSWGHYQNDLTIENWDKLSSILSDDNTYIELLQNSYALICENENGDIIGMAYLVSSGNPTDIFDINWSYIRFVSVNPLYGDHGIGRKLTEKCIEKAKENNEDCIALHTSIIMKKARHLYESLGFKILREIEPRLGKRYWLYTLKLES